MLINKLKQYADKLLDLSSRNKLINFRDTKVSTAKLLYPSAEDLFSYIINSESETSFIIHNKKDELSIDEEIDELNDEDELKKNDEYLLKLYEKQLVKKNSLLFYNKFDTYSALKSINKKNLEYYIETGNNITYLAFGFLKWKENENSRIEYNSPLLLIKCKIVKEENGELFRLLVEENDVSCNTSLKYKLKNELNIVLPEYNDTGLNEYIQDVNKILNKCWGTVICECKISNIQFHKLNMYEDIHTNMQLILDNPIIDKLLGDDTIDINNDIDESFKNDKYNPIIDLHNVVEADSSQLKAIEAAKSGISFVLQGPPGTGKSQTITNIISECLYDHKKVLFVSEKIAALNIVYNNLKEAGLEDFCLRLHSKNTNKSEFLNDLSDTIRKEKIKVSEKTEDYEDRHREYVDKLDSYVRELYSTHEIINCSLKELLSKYFSYINIPDVKYYNPLFVEKDEKWIIDQKDMINRLIMYLNQFNLEIENNLWYGINLDNKSTSEVAENIEKDKEMVELYLSFKKELESLFGIRIVEKDELKKFICLKSLKENYSLKLNNFINVNKFTDLNNLIKETNNRKNKVFKNLFEIRKKYSISLLDVYNKDDKNYLEEDCNKWYKRVFNGKYWNIKRKYKKIIINDKSNFNTILCAMKKYESYSDALSSFNDFVDKNELDAKLCGEYKGIDTDFDIIENFIKDVIEVRSLFDEDRNYNINNDIIDYINTNNSSINELINYNFKTTEYINYTKKFDININDEHIVKIMDDLYNNVYNIQEWKQYLDLYNRIDKVKLISFVKLCKKNNINDDDISKALLKSFFKQWIDKIIEKNIYLKDFDRLKHDEIIAEFDKTDIIKYKINQSKIKAELSCDRPNMSLVDINSNSSVSRILRESAKKKKQKPIKDVIGDNGSFIQSIKPCFLMSPLSVSTYLKENAINFDVVIFDEASQIFLEDAICSIYRGKQLIIVGDSKQMPPTDFFTTDFEVDDSLESDVGTYDSVLDIGAAVLPEIRLSWHYRSRDESLILFSNNYFYNNNLVTFKSVNNIINDYGVDFEYVPNGCYSNGRNLIEAKKVIDILFEHFDKYHNTRSIGIIAFGVKQEEAIENELEKRLEENPEYKEFCSISEDNEPFFIKNLETVQGDERDTIIFSIGYGHDEQGKFLLNFGPLSRQGGERRLNVAITRAKYNVKVVSSIKGNEIDVSRISFEGGKLLSKYLQYAEDGLLSIKKDVEVEEWDLYDSEFEADVCNFLRDNGYDVDTQVGSSGYRIDMAIKYPNTSNYYLAIECDGASYHSSKNARDRDRIRQKVLENLGWRFYRIWSTDWYLNNKYEKKRLLEFIANMKNIDMKNSVLHNNQKKNEFDEDVKSEFELISIDNDNTFPPYKISKAKNDISFPNFIKKVLEIEAPLSEEWFLKRNLKLFKREKLTDFVWNQFNMWMNNVMYDKNCNIIRKDGFLFIKSKNIIFRTQGKEKRPFEYISSLEIASGMYVILKNNLSMEIDSLFKQICKLQECTLTDSHRIILKEAIKKLKGIKKSNIIVEGSIIRYVE